MATSESRAMTAETAALDNLMQALIASDNQKKLAPILRLIFEQSHELNVIQRLETFDEQVRKDIKALCKKHGDSLFSTLSQLTDLTTTVIPSLSTVISSAMSRLSAAMSSLRETLSAFQAQRESLTNVTATIAEVRRYQLALDLFRKAGESMERRRYYPAIRTLAELEGTALSVIRGDHFGSRLQAQIPAMRERIKHLVLASVVDWLDQVKLASEEVGRAAFEEASASAQRYRRPAEPAPAVAASRDDDPLSSVASSLTTVAQASSVMAALHERGRFQVFYAQQRARQIDQLLSTNMPFWSSFERYFWAIAGHFVIEATVQQTLADVVSPEDVSARYTGAVQRIKSELQMELAYHETTAEYAPLRRALITFCTVLQQYDYPVAELTEFASQTLRAHYFETAQRALANQLEEAFATPEGLQVMGTIPPGEEGVAAIARMTALQVQEPGGRAIAEAVLRVVDMAQEATMRPPPFFGRASVTYYRLLARFSAETRDLSFELDLVPGGDAEAAPLSPSYRCRRLSSSLEPAAVRPSKSSHLIDPVIHSMLSAVLRADPMTSDGATTAGWQRRMAAVFGIWLIQDAIDQLDAPALREIARAPCVLLRQTVSGLRDRLRSAIRSEVVHGLRAMIRAWAAARRPDASIETPGQAAIDAIVEMVAHSQRAAAAGAAIIARETGINPLTQIGEDHEEALADGFIEACFPPAIKIGPDHLKALAELVRRLAAQFKRICLVPPTLASPTQILVLLQQDDPGAFLRDPVALQEQQQLRYTGRLAQLVRRAGQDLGGWRRYVGGRREREQAFEAAAEIVERRAAAASEGRDRDLPSALI